jgi:hypothetical protein
VPSVDRKIHLLWMFSTDEVAYEKCQRNIITSTSASTPTMSPKQDNPRFYVRGRDERLLRMNPQRVGAEREDSTCLSGAAMRA